MNLRREGGKRWVELALSYQTSAVLANWIKTCVHKQSPSASSGDIEFCPSPDILSHFFKGSFCWEDFPDTENENADVVRTTEASERHRKQKCLWEADRGNLGLKNACTVSIHLAFPGRVHLIAPKPVPAYKPQSS